MLTRSSLTNPCHPPFITCKSAGLTGVSLEVVPASVFLAVPWQSHDDNQENICLCNISQVALAKHGIVRNTPRVVPPYSGSKVLVYGIANWRMTIDSIRIDSESSKR